MTKTEKIYIIGHYGSGKTSFATRLSQKLDYPHISLDSFWHKYKGDRSTFKEEVLKQLETNRWIAEGKHKTVRKQIIELADLIIYLDLSIAESIINNIQRAINNKEPVLKFTKHLFKVIKEFYFVNRKLKTELTAYNYKLIVLKSFQEMDNYLEKVK